MEFRAKIFFIGIILFIIFIFLFIAAYAFLLFEGKAILTRKLEGVMHRRVSIDCVRLTPPFNLEIKRLDIEGLVRVDYIFISPDILGLITGNIALNNLVFKSPRLIYERKQAAITESSLDSTTTVSSAGSQANVDNGRSATKTSTTPASDFQAASGNKQPPSLIFKRLSIKDGQVNFIDHTLSDGVLKITIKDINFHLTNLYVLPRSVVTNFALEGKIPWQEGHEEGKIKAEGWLNLFKKDMQASLKIEDIDGIYLYPYYSNWVNLEKARIEKAKLNFTSNIQGFNNDITANCHLELVDIVRKPRAADEPQEKAERITDAVLDIFRALNQGKIVLDFAIKTRMDRPEFGFGNIRMALENKLTQSKGSNGFKAQDIFMLPAKLLEGAVKGTTDLSKAVISGTFAVGNELKKAVEGTFKKEQKEQQK